MIEYKVGDATEPNELKTGKVLLLHCVNDLYVFGAGIAATIAKKWPRVEEIYQKYGEQYTLGDVQYVCTEEKNPKFVIGNIFGQKGCGPNDVGMLPIRYEALYEGFLRVKKWVALQEKKYDTEYQVVSCKIGCGLAGGSWSEVEALINKAGLDITIYDLPTPYKPFTQRFYETSKPS